MRLHTVGVPQPSSIDNLAKNTHVAMTSKHHARSVLVCVSRVCVSRVCVTCVRECKSDSLGESVCACAVTGRQAYQCV